MARHNINAGKTMRAKHTPAAGEDPSFLPPPLLQLPPHPSRSFLLRKCNFYSYAASILKP